MRRVRWLILLPTLLTLAAVPAGAHHDHPPDGVPALKTTVTVNNVQEIRINDLLGINDGLDGDTELLLTVETTQPGHDPSAHAFFIEDFDYFAAAAPGVEQFWAIDAPLGAYNPHDDCHPRQKIELVVRLRELDNDSVDSVLAAFTSAAAGVTTATLGVGVGVSIAITAAGLVVSLAVAFDGDEDLGFGSLTVPENGTAFADLVMGDDGSGIVSVSDSTVFAPAENDRCFTDPPPGEPTPTERADSIFPFLQDALDAIPFVDAEAGNPAGLTAERVLLTRRMLTSFTLGLAEVVTGAEIEDASDFGSTRAAIQDFATAQALAEGGDFAGALAAFESAYLEAARARSGGAPPRQQSGLPFQLLTTSEFFSTNPGSELEAVVLAVGGDTFDLAVRDEVPGLDVRMERISPEAPAYRMQLSVGDVAPGTHELHLTATSGSAQAERTVTVAVHAAAGCVSTSTALCLNRGRFRVTAQWETPAGTSGAGKTIPLTAASGLFWFFDEENVEIVAKVLNACGLNGHYWFFAAGLTNVEVTLTVTDTKTGQSRTYVNPLGTSFMPVLDTGALPTCP